MRRKHCSCREYLTFEMHSKQWKILLKATSKQGARFGEQLIGIACATRLFQTGTFDEQTIMSRTGHRSTAVRSYKWPSSSLGKAVTDALQPPSGDLEDLEGKIKKLRHRTEMNQNLNCLQKHHL